MRRLNPHPTHRRPTAAGWSSAFLAFVLLAGACGGGGGGGAGGAGGAGGTAGTPDVENPRTPGQTEFESEEPGGSRLGGPARGEAGSADNAAPPGAPTADGSSKAPPMGRTDAVEEADIYRVDANRLFYLNTYRGFVIYDLGDPKKPQRLGRLPVYGYPVEMFVSGTTVYALLRDALYLTQKQGAMRFERHNVSQLVAIDVADPRNPKLLKTVDILGELREGVSRKVGDTIYVVSYVSQQYWWGFRAPGATAPQKERATVYSFNVKNPQAPQLVQELKIFEGGSIQFSDPKTGSSLQRTFQGVAISATSNTLMVVENWWLSSYTAPGSTSSSGGGAVAEPGRGGGACGSFSSDQQAVVSIVDISDPSGAIKVHTRFETAGALNDQFKQTYAYDPATKTAAYFGIFNRRAWSGSGCTGQSFTQNTVESWDVTDGTKPVRQSALDIGKPNETVRGSAFDLERKVAYAITAQQIDPLYVIGLDNPKALKIRSLIDGLSGDMNVFRLVENRDFLIGIGRDNSVACQGLQDTQGWAPTQVAVSLIDVRNLDAIRLVQRQCLTVKNADWIGSAVNWDLDQAHKMIGMHSDGAANVLTVPIHYAKRADQEGFWWYRFETAVGLMSWDVGQYDPTKAPAQQTVIRNHGTFVHPEGEVRRSIVFTHQGATPQRMMVNLSDTHVSVVNVQDLSAPKLESVVEVAPYHHELFRFGDYVVEHLKDTPDGWYGSSGRSEFRVKPAGGELEESPAVATFVVGQVERVIKHGDRLVLFRWFRGGKLDNAGQYIPPEREAVVFDLADPTKPKVLGRTKLPDQVGMPYYRFYCGGDGYWGGFWFDGEGANWAATQAGLVFFFYDYGANANPPRAMLGFLDLRAGQPAYTQQEVPRGTTTEVLGLVADPVDATGFWLSSRTKVGEVKAAGDTTGQLTLAKYRYHAERIPFGLNGYVLGGGINVPGRLVRTFLVGKERVFLTQDSAYWLDRTTQGTQTYTNWRTEMRLNLLRQISSDGRTVAELLDTNRFADTYLADLVVEGTRMFATARTTYWYGGYGYADVAVPAGGGVRAAAQEAAKDGSDRLVVFDLGQLKLTRTYDQPTGAYGLHLVGTYQGRLFANLQGDGLLMIDVANPAAPSARQFLRTLGWGTHVEFAGGSAYVAAGYFGVYRMPLDAPPSIALD